MELRAGYKRTEIGIFPKDWEVKKLEQVSLFFNGKAHEQAIDENGKYVVVNSKFVSTEGLIFKNSKEAISPLQKGDITMVMSDIPNGKALAKCYLIEKNDKYTLNQRICSIKTELCDNVFLFYILNRNKYFLSFDSGSGQTNLRRKEVLDCPLVLPPTKAEQSAIATALTDADALITSLEKLITKKRNIKQGTMQKLLQPKEGWVVKKLGDLTKVFTKQTGFDYTAYIKPSLVQYRTDDTIPFIQNKDFNNRWINFDTDYFIPKNIAIQFPKILLNEKSLLISISGSVGNIGIFDSLELAFIGGAVAILKFKDSDLIDWVMFYLNSVDGQKKLLDNVKAGSHQNLILDDIRKIDIVFPTKQEQKQIDTILSDIDAEINALETKLEKYKKVKLGMMQNLLTGKIRLI